MAVNRPDLSKRYTFSDMETWEEPERFELIDGTPFLLASPGVEHEDVSTQLRTVFNEYVRRNRPECRVYGDPAGILLDEGERNVVRPDLFVVCQPMIKNGQMLGVPLFIVEILSKSTASYDVHVKYRLYERYGIREYWVVDPLHQLVQVYHLNQKEYEFAGQFSKEDVIETKVFEDFGVRLGEIFLL